MVGAGSLSPGPTGDEEDEEQKDRNERALNYACRRRDPFGRVRLWEDKDTVLRVCDLEWVRIG